MSSLKAGAVRLLVRLGWLFADIDNGEGGGGATTCVPKGSIVGDVLGDTSGTPAAGLGDG